MSPTASAAARTIDTLVTVPERTHPKLRPAFQLADEANSLQVTRATKAGAERLILALADMEKEVHALLDPICDATHKAWKTATTARGEYLKPIEAAKARLRRECGRIQLELEQEARRQADEEAAARKREQEAEALQHAAALETAGDVEMAQAVLEEAQHAPAPVAEVAQVETETQYRDKWTYTIFNIKELPAEYLIADEKAIGRVVNALKERTNIPGVRVEKTRVPVSVAAKPGGVKW